MRPAASQFSTDDRQTFIVNVLCVLHSQIHLLLGGTQLNKAPILLHPVISVIRRHPHPLHCQKLQFHTHFGNSNPIMHRTHSNCIVFFQIYCAEEHPNSIQLRSAKLRALIFLMLSRPSCLYMKELYIRAQSELIIIPDDVGHL